jgi:hypothetical protein
MGADLDQAELNEAASVLYSIKPDEFAASRDDAARRARADGHAELAREIGKLRKPTQSAWLINLLARDQEVLLTELFDLARELSEAQGSGRNLQSLNARRREIDNALIRRARELAEREGTAVSAAAERDISDTLAAALADPEVAAQVREGRLVKPVSYAGFGMLGEVKLDRPDAPSAEREESRAPGPAPRRGVKREASEGVEEADEALVRSALAALKKAEELLAERSLAAEVALNQQERLAREIDQLNARLRNAKIDFAAAKGAASRANRLREQAEKGVEAARQSVAQAEKAHGSRRPREK